MNPLKQNKGFTLFEALIALAIIAIALSAAIKASAMAADTARELKLRQLAGYVAQNRLAEHNALGDWPSIGSLDGTQNQAGIDFNWHEEISDTPNPVFRKIDITVSTRNKQASAHLMAYLLRPSS